SGEVRSAKGDVAIVAPTSDSGPNRLPFRRRTDAFFGWPQPASVAAAPPDLRLDALRAKDSDGASTTAHAARCRGRGSRGGRAAAELVQRFHQGVWFRRRRPTRTAALVPLLPPSASLRAFRQRGDRGRRAPLWRRGRGPVRSAPPAGGSSTAGP